MKAAAAAVDVLSKPMLTELKNLKVRICIPVLSSSCMVQR